MSGTQGYGTAVPAHGLGSCGSLTDSAKDALGIGRSRGTEAPPTRTQTLATNMEDPREPQRLVRCLSALAPMSVR